MVLISLMAVLGVTVLFMLAVLWFIDAPNRPKWESSVSKFDEVVATMPPAPPGKEWVDFDVPARIGEYNIRSAARVKSGAVFYDAEGCGFLDEAGFAYLPNGIDPNLENGTFERPRYKSLGGPWYSFCASW